MTRWARSKGSAASNERVEEEATPWSQLVSGMKQKPDSNVEDLDEEFEEQEPVEKVEFSRVDDKEESDEEAIEEAEDKKESAVAQIEEKSDEKKKKKRKRTQDKCLNCKQKGHLKKECPELTEERRKELQELYTMKIERKGHGTGRKKNKNKRKAAEAGENEIVAPAKKAKENHKDKKSKPVLDKTGQVVQDGEGMFQGFRVRKQDVKKLNDLHKKLKNDNASDTEIAETLKRERRRAERELARYNKMVCFNCRQSGHVLADCPKQTQGAKSENIYCFKCGSGDHTSKNCVSKLKGADAYQFATCFICKETGHLAKSCPDNPRGLYPKGGGCRFCGSVEHLKADCPRKSQKDARSEVRISALKNSHHIEDIVDDGPTAKQQFQKSQKKVVKF